MEYIIGIDQGGTKTHVALMDKTGKLLSDHKTEGCYFPEDGIETAVEIIGSAVDAVLSKAGVNIAEVEIIVAGVTGVDYDGDEELVRSALQERFGSKEIVVCNDCEIGYFGGSQNPVGAVICAGTGINAALFAPDNQKFVMGDYLKSSLQGGAGITNRAIEAVVEADLGVLPATAMTQLFLDFAQEDSVFDLLRKFITTEDFSSEMISLAPDIIESANNGDTLAQGVLSDFSAELCACFAAALRKMDMIDLACDVVLSGSVFKGRINYLTTLMEKRLLEAASNIKIIHAEFEPAVGACILGIIRKAGSFDENMKENTKCSGAQLGLLRC